MPPPSPAARATRAVDPVGADDRRRAATRLPPTVSSAPSGPIVRPSTVTPSRKSAPAAAACSARKASSRRRRVIRTSGSSRPPLEALPVAEAHLERPHDVLDDGVDGARQLAHGPSRHAAAAGLVAREAGAVGEQDSRPPLASRIAVADPAGPAPTTIASNRSTGGSYASRPATLRRAQGCPSGQRERAVNPPAQPTKVRILPPAYRPCLGHIGPSRVQV